MSLCDRILPLPGAELSFGIVPTKLVFLDTLNGAICSLNPATDVVIPPPITISDGAIGALLPTLNIPTHLWLLGAFNGTACSLKPSTDKVFPMNGVVSICKGIWKDGVAYLASWVILGIFTCDGAEDVPHL